MNKLVNELVLKAQMSTISDTPDGGKSFDLDLFHEKFAELIVRECAQVCRSQPNEYALAVDRENCASAIEEHFGVEE